MGSLSAHGVIQTPYAFWIIPGATTPLAPGCLFFVQFRTFPYSYHPARAWVSAFFIASIRQLAIAPARARLSVRVGIHEVSALTWGVRVFSPCVQSTHK